MTAAEKLAILKRWQAAIGKSDMLIDPVIDALQLAPESPVNEAVWGLQAELTVMVAELVGDKDGLLEWHALENEMGARHREVGPVGITPPIRALEDLLQVIERQQANGRIDQPPAIHSQRQTWLVQKMEKLAEMSATVKRLAEGP